VLELFMAHWLLAVQAAQLPSTHTGRAGSRVHSVEPRHATQAPARAPLLAQRGVEEPHSLSLPQGRQRPAATSQTGVEPLHWEFIAHCTQVLLANRHTGVTAGQSALAVHWTQRPALSHTGAPGGQSALLTQPVRASGGGGRLPSGRGGRSNPSGASGPAGASAAGASTTALPSPPGSGFPGVEPSPVGVVGSPLTGDPSGGMSRQSAVRQHTLFSAETITQMKPLGQSPGWPHFTLPAGMVGSKVQDREARSSAATWIVRDTLSTSRSWWWRSRAPRAPASR